MSVQVNNVVEDCHATSWSRNDKRGFTLVELLVVIAIIAILAVVGMVVFRGIMGGARDSTRKADVDAMVNAYEVKANGDSYQPISDPDFSSGKKPKDPNPTKGDYFNYLAADGSGYKICAALDGNPNAFCNTPGTNCYCQFSAQSTINPGSGVNQSGSTNYGSGPGGSTPLACDPNGTLLSGLIGYWKMDEASYNGTSGEVKDSSGKGNNGDSVCKPAGFCIPPKTAGGKFNNAVRFTNLGDSLIFPTTGTNNLFHDLSALTISYWVKLDRIPSLVEGGIPFRVSSSYTTFASPFSSGRLDNNGKMWGGFADLDTVDGMDSNSRTAAPQQDVPLQINTWYHLVTLYNPVDLKTHLYINGRETSYDIQEVARGGGLFNPSNYLLILGNPAANMNWLMPGYIDDFRIYNRVLSSDEIFALYFEGAGCIPQ